MRLLSGSTAQQDAWKSAHARSACAERTGGPMAFSGQPSSPGDAPTGRRGAAYLQQVLIKPNRELHQAARRLPLGKGRGRRRISLAIQRATRQRPAMQTSA